MHQAVAEASETVKWGAPAYILDGKILLITAAFQKHVAINFWRGQELRGAAAQSEGMGQFGKLSSLDDLPNDEELDALIRQAAELVRSGTAPRQTKRGPKPAIQMHPDFAEALEAAPKAREVLASFPPSAQRDYLEWISGAKQDATRKKRIATAIDWLNQGKRRHWKYQDC